jgi:hypothetical protein
MENEIDGKLADMSPASAQVIKTGLVPQVDSKEIDTRQKEEHDKLQALDGHFQRIETIIPSLKSDSPKLQKIERFCKAVLAKWDEIKQEDDQSNDGQSASGFSEPYPRRVDWMKQNQPLPETPRSMAGQVAF